MKPPHAKVLDMAVSLAASEPGNPEMAQPVLSLLQAFRHLRGRKDLLDGDEAEALFFDTYANTYFEKHDRLARNATLTRYDGTEEDRADLLSGIEYPESIGRSEDRVYPQAFVRQVAHGLAVRDAVQTVNVAMLQQRKENQ